MRLAAFTSLAILGLTALLVVLVNDNQTAGCFRNCAGWEPVGLALLAVFAMVVVVAALWGKQSCLAYAVVPLTLAVSIVALMIGTFQPS
jgi:hypothetical protein